ncbi:hypothetical protein BD410DRAFT_844534 [Rickenella mellea]|uniref:Uncharacterized protein n=1 Tax=Rickenella mellea TaxID=50990 RepID=A0A4Y7PLD1_9AGAM|nr:hypothetical protein BD410DRAFT_844534 [Rickenella mellea]
MDVPHESSEWDMPLLTKFDGYRSSFPWDVSNPFLSQLTCMTLRFENDYDFDVTALAQVLHMTLNLRELSLEFHDCDGPELDAIDMEVLPDTPEPHSFDIESLQITLRHSVPRYVVEHLYSILEYLNPSLVDISLLVHGGPYEYLLPPQSGRGIYPITIYPGVVAGY